MEYFLQIAVNSVVLASLYALLALGFNLLYSTNKFFDLSYAAYIVLGAYAYLVLVPLHIGVMLTFMFALCVVALFSLATERFLYTALRKKKSSGAVMMIASLGVLTVVQALIALVFTSNIQTLRVANDSFALFGTVITSVQIAIVASAVLAYLTTYLVFRYASFGIQIRAMADNEELATIAKLPVKMIRILSTILAAGLGALAAILYGMDTSVEPYMGMQLLLKGVIVAIIGGLGSVMFGIVGALLLATIENLAIWYVGGEWKDAIAFCILIIILLLRPTGILSHSK